MDVHSVKEVGSSVLAIERLLGAWSVVRHTHG